MLGAVTDDGERFVALTRNQFNAEVAKHCLRAICHEFGEKFAIVLDNASYFIANTLEKQAAADGLDFRSERHGNRNGVERVLREGKRRTASFSNCFSHADPATADEWLRSFAVAWNLRIRTLPTRCSLSQTTHRSESCRDRSETVICPITAARDAPPAALQPRPMNRRYD